MLEETDDDQACDDGGPDLHYRTGDAVLSAGGGGRIRGISGEVNTIFRMLLAFAGGEQTDCDGKRDGNRHPAAVGRDV